jgi:hypothetical protein
MFDDVIIAVSNDESALDALALGWALASPGAMDRAAPSIRSSSSAPRRPRPVCTTSRRAAARICS